MCFGVVSTVESCICGNRFPYSLFFGVVGLLSLGGDCLVI